MSVTEIVNRMFIFFFAFLLYNMPFFTPPQLLLHWRYLSEILSQNHNMTLIIFYKFENATMVKGIGTF